MGRKEDLESHIRENYELIRQYETVVRQTSRPEERREGQRVIDGEWAHIQGDLAAYLPLCGQLLEGMPADLLELTARFPEYANLVGQAVHQRLSGDVRAALQEEGLAEPEQARRVIAAALPGGRPLLFQRGLCAGYPLEPAPQQYFVSQSLGPGQDDLLRALEAAFQPFDLQPYRADQDVRSGHVLCKIAAKIQTTLFGIFELTSAQNRDVYLELGVAMGLGRPFVLVKEAAAVLSPLAQGLDHYNLRSYVRMRHELGQRLEQYLLQLARYERPTQPQPGPATHPTHPSTYVIAHGDRDMPADFCLAVAGALAGRGLDPLLLGEDNREAAELLELSGLACQTADAVGQSRLDAAARAIQTARFGLYRVDADCSPDTFLALGLAIGTNRPWVLVSREGAALPSNLRGLSGLAFRSFDELGRLLPQRFGSFLQRYA